MPAPSRRRGPLGLDVARSVTLAGVAAAMFVAVVLNVLGARHWRRWDWTKGGLYTLSDATRATLHGLPDRVEIWLLTGSEEPLGQSLKQLLTSYASETDKLDLHYVDPDKDTFALLDVQKRFNIEAGKAENGRVVTDAVMVVARGERHWFLSPSDMVEVTDAEDTRAKPKEEQAITLAIRSVLEGEKAKLCFTAGHGELSLADGGPEGLGFLKDFLAKDNYEAVAVDTTEPNTHAPFTGCSVVVVAGPRGAFGKEEAARLRTYLMSGGSALVAVSPIVGADAAAMETPGLGEPLTPFGVELDEDVVIEADPKLRTPGQLAAFFVTAKAHPVSGALVKDGNREPPKVMVGIGIKDARILTRSMHRAGGGAAQGAALASDLLVTSDSAFGVTSIVGANAWPDEGPERKPTDLPGPLVIAMASERPKVSPSASRGPRVVVVGTASMLLEHNWHEPIPVHGAAFFMENAISWLAARPGILDVPDKATVPAGLRISDDSRLAIRRYVLLYMPLAGALLGLAVWLRRRSTETKPARPASPEPPDGAGTP